jgi:hypothetical protein
MKMNTNSMDKLFDLMVMGIKQEIIHCRSPNEIYKITLNHFDGILGLVTEDKTRKLIESAKAQFISIFSKFTAHDYCVLRDELLKFVQVKLSISAQTAL